MDIRLQGAMIVLVPLTLCTALSSGCEEQAYSPAEAVPAAGAVAITANPAVGTSGHPLMGLPAYPAVQYPPENLDDDAKFQLGKLLFWEEQLSGNNAIACGTCHMGRAGGSDPRSANEEARLLGDDGILDATPGIDSDDRRGALGIVACGPDGSPKGARVQVTGRKAPSAFDAMFSAELFWDGRAGAAFVDPESGSIQVAAGATNAEGLTIGGALESQAVGPLMSEVEMACESPTWRSLSDRLGAAQPLSLARNIPADSQAFIAQHGASYPAMFAEAFGADMKPSADEPDGVITPTRIAFAIATYERRLTSDQTPWDRWNAGEAGALSAEEVRGFEVFMGTGNCQLCHAPPLFTDHKLHYLGFHPPDRDGGRGALPDQPATELGKMKTPTLRNVGLREPGGLLHQGDGPGHDLLTVLELYRIGGLADDPEIARRIDPLVMPLNVTAEDMTALAAFLRRGLTDPRAENEQAPFDRPTLSHEP